MKFLAILAIATAAALTATSPASAGGCNFGANSFGFGGFHGQSFHAQNFGGRVRVQGNNGVRSAGGRRLVFVGFDRFGNPVFR